MIKGLSDRYEDECKMLAYLARKQLNLEKNRSKEDFENMKIEDIFFGIIEEVKEVDKEIFEIYEDGNCLRSRKKQSVNLQLLQNEIADVASYCVGVIAWINHQRDQQSEDGA